MKSRGLDQAYRLQDLAYEMAQALRESALDPETGKLVIRRDQEGRPVDAQPMAAIIKSWEIAQVRVAFHRGKPSPGALRPEAKRKPRRTGAAGGSLARIMPLPQATDQGAAAEDQQPTDPDVPSAPAPDTNELPPAVGGA